MPPVLLLCQENTCIGYTEQSKHWLCRNPDMMIFKILFIKFKKDDDKFNDDDKFKKDGDNVR